MSKQNFSGLPLGEQVQKVRACMEAGHSNTSAAKELGTTPGTVAGIRRRKGIPSKNLPASAAPAKRRGALQLKIAASEAAQCEYEAGGHRCAYEKAPDSRFCALPAHQKRKSA